MPSTAVPVTWEAFQGRTRDFSRSTPNDDGSFGTTPPAFAGTEPITYTVWDGGTGPPLLAATGPPNGWVDASLLQWSIRLADAQTRSLSPGVYDIEVTAPPAAGDTVSLFRGLLRLYASATPGAPAAAAAPLIDPPACLAQLTTMPIPLTNAQLAMVPDLIVAASEAIERWCHRKFARMVEVVDASLSTYGEARLWRPPVHRIIRLQADPQPALVITNSATSLAWVNLDAPPASGIVLNWNVAGAINGLSIPFASLPDQQIGTLAEAVRAVGQGWAASAAYAYHDWPIAELADLDLGGGAGPVDFPRGPATYHVYSRVLADYRPAADLGEKTGIYVVGQRGSTEEDAWRWGPGGPELFGLAEGIRQGPRRVRFTYDGGFAPIPAMIRQAAAEWVRAALLRLNTDWFLRSERADHYQYELNDRWLMQLMGQMPPNVMSLISSYRLPPA